MHTLTYKLKIRVSNKLVIAIRYFINQIIVTHIITIMKKESNPKQAPNSVSISIQTRRERSSRGHVSSTALHQRLRVASSVKELANAQKHLDKNHQSIDANEAQPNSNYNKIKMRRFLREEKAKSKSTNRTKQLRNSESYLRPHADSLKIDKLITDKLKGPVNTQNLIKEQQVIKGYISQLQNILITINEEKQKTQRKVTSVEKLKKPIFTERKLLLDEHKQKENIKQPINFQSKQLQLKSISDVTNPLEELKHSTNFNKIIASKEHSSSSLLESIISKTKKQKKILSLKQVRNRYKELSASKQDQSSNRKLISETQSIGNLKQKSESLREPEKVIKSRGRKMVRAYNPFKILRSMQSQNIGNHMLNQEKQNNPLQLQDPKPINQNIIKQNPTIEQQNSKILFSDFSSPLNIKKTSIVDDKGLAIDCSRIDLLKNQESFISQQLIENIKSTQEKHHQVNGRILDLLDLDTGECKNLLKNREQKRKHQLQRWKKNFPIGFFDDH